MKLNYDKAQLEAVVDKVAERTMNMDMTWDWPCGVYMVSTHYRP